MKNLEEWEQNPGMYSDYHEYLKNEVMNVIIPFAVRASDLLPKSTVDDHRDVTLTIPAGKLRALVRLYCELLAPVGG